MRTTATKKDSALQLAALNFHVFPLAPGQKAPPLIEGFPNHATRSPDVIAKWWTTWPDANIGLSTSRYGENGALLVVDVDVAKGKSGRNTLLHLELAGHDFPDTRTQTTPSGGQHLIYHVPVPVKQGVDVLGSGLDIRSRGGYVVGAGSVVNGREYTANKLPVVDAPDWLIKKCGDAGTAARAAGQAAEDAALRAASDAPVSVDAERARARAAHYLQREAPLAVEGQGGDPTTYIVAARCKDHGTTQQETAALMLEHWNPRCSPPWPPEDLNTKVANAYTYGTEPRGSAAPEIVFPPVVPSTTDEDPFDDSDPASLSKDARPPYRPDASRIGDVFTTEPPSPRFIVENYYPVACGQEHSIGGTGKTTRRIYESIHVILGRPLFGRRILQPGPVLIVSKEDGLEQFRYRLHHIALALNLSPAERAQVANNFHVLDLTGDIAGRLVAVDRAGNLIATDLAERIYLGYRGEGLAQVIFDPWNGFGPGERYVNDAEAALMVLGALVSRELAANVCYVGHVSKEVGRKGIIDAHSGRGGAAMGDNARFVFGYVHHDPADPSDKKHWRVPASAEQAAAQGTLYRLHNVKQSYGKRILEPLWIERQGFNFRLHEGAPVALEAALHDEGERIKRFVREELERGTKYTPDRLAEQRERYGLSRSKARQVIAWLQSNGGLIERPLPEAERRTKATHFLEPVFPAAEALGSREELFGDDAA